MKTIVSNWQIVSILHGEELIGKVLYGHCVEDMTYRFSPGNYITTSMIKEISHSNQLIKTASGSSYKLIGEGGKAEIQFRCFDLLRQGFSPSQITQLDLAPSDYFH